jgi:hypothetical protein
LLERPKLTQTKYITIYGQAISLCANVRLIRKAFQGQTTLAYSGQPAVTLKKSFLALSSNLLFLNPVLPLKIHLHVRLKWSYIAKWCDVVKKNCTRYQTHITFEKLLREWSRSIWPNSKIFIDHLAGKA